MECEKGIRKTEFEKRCPNGTRRNKAGVCARKRILNTVTPDSVYRGKPLLTIQDSEAFIQLCKKHILRPNLESVQGTYWLLNGDSNIFMIAEIHKPYQTCDSILEMFKALLKENSRPVDIDIMIEDLQGAIRHKIKTLLKHAQINRIREFFRSCIANKNCSARVHWTDPTYTEKGNPEWIQALGNEKYYSKLYTREWMKDPLIHAEIQSKEDIVKILTKNVYVVKEIEKASKVYPRFTVDFVAKDFMSSMNQDLRNLAGWEECVIFMSRRVMDYYTVARIIKSRMKNVIIYAGANHIKRMILILGKTGYSIQKHVKGKCVE